MLKRIAGLGLSLLVGASVWAQTTPDESVAEASLAERFASMAQRTLSDPQKQTITDADWQQALALYQAAAKLNPKEPRFAKLVAEANLKVGDRKAALDAYRTYSQLPKQDGADVAVALQIIDLYSADMESADAKLKYFEDLLTKELAPEVKSRVAVRAAKLRAERSEEKESADLVAQALKLDPVNPEALAMKYQSLQSGSAVDRFGVLLQMILANPRQPDVMVRIADDLSSVGLPAEAASWYMQAIQLNNRLALPPNLQNFQDYCAALTLAGQSKFARGTADQVLQGIPTNPDMLFLKLLIDKGGDADAQKKNQEAATAGMLENIYTMHRKVMGSDSPTTKPSGELAERLPDLNALATKAKASGDETVINALAQTLTDIAWLQIYFEKAPQNATAAIEALKVLMPADNVTVSRLEGWAFLAGGKNDEAKVKLSAVADRDVLSQMGMIRLNAAANAEQAKADANKLISENGSGLVGVMLVDGLKEVGGVIAPAADAPAYKDQLAKFPKKWLDILDQPQQFYQMRVDAAKVAHAYDEPIFATIEITNITENDLTIGDNGAVRPDWWFDCSIRAGQSGNIPGAAYARLDKRFVLKRGETVQQIVRLDQYPKLLPALSTNPVFAMQLYFTALTNPNPTGAGVGPGPAGNRVNVRKVVERTGIPITQPQTQQKMLAAIAGGAPDEKLRTISALAELAAAWSNEQAPQQTKDAAKKLLEAVDDARNDELPAVRGWAMYRSAIIRSNDQKKVGATQMLSDPNWIIRALGVLAAGGLSKEDAAAVLESAKTDQEPIIALLAKSTVEVVKHAATQPTTAPSSQPTSQPGDMLPGFNLGK